MNTQQLPPRTHWYDRPFIASALGGLIPLAVTYLGSLIGPVLFTESIDPRIYAAFAGIILIVVSLLTRSIRGWWFNLFRRLASVRVTTKGRMAMKVANALASRPTHDDVKRAYAQGRETGLMTGEEKASQAWEEVAARDVMLRRVNQRVSELELRLADARKNARKSEQGAEQRTSQLLGLTAERDDLRRELSMVRKERDRNAVDIDALTKEVKRARDQGVAEGMKLGERRATEQVANQPRVPRPDPRWMVVRLPSKYGKDIWALRNLVPRSIAREVRIESDDDLTITDAGHWSDLSPAGTSPVEGTFTGRLTQRGRHEGVNFTITWFDEAGNRRETTTWVEGAGAADAWA